ncbi:hypothetical protein [Haladaptatus salinisoli]|nr:hypothetical protein [Haladaptatus salinisoli]
MRKLVRDGAIGDRVAVRGHMGQRMLDVVSTDLDQWRLDSELAGSS